MSMAEYSAKSICHFSLPKDSLGFIVGGSQGVEELLVITTRASNERQEFSTKIMSSLYFIETQVSLG